MSVKFLITSDSFFLKSINMPMYSHPKGRHSFLTWALLQPHSYEQIKKQILLNVCYCHRSMKTGQNLPLIESRKLCWENQTAFYISNYGFFHYLLFFFFTACCIHYLRAQSVLSLCLWTLPQFVLSFQLEFNWRQWISWRQWGEVQVLLETLAPADDLSELQHHVSMPTESTWKGTEGTVAGKKKYQEFHLPSGRIIARTMKIHKQIQCEALRDMA